MFILRNFANAPQNYNLNKYDIGLVELNALQFEKKNPSSPLGLSKGFVYFRGFCENLRVEYANEMDF